jgi:gliding motility-associated lipoprotein GldH
MLVQHSTFNIQHSIIIGFCLLLITSCIDSSIITFETKNLRDKNWNFKDTLTFKSNIEDIKSTYNCFIDVRNSGDYPYSNLFMFVTTCFPDGEKSRDTVQTILADSQGKWLGKGLGDIKETRLLLKRVLIFPQKGNYTFKVVQAMRQADLKGIYSIALRIEKNQN